MVDEMLEVAPVNDTFNRWVPGMMNNRFAITLLIVAGNIAFAQEPAVDRRILDENILLERLQSGGLVLVFRHGETGPDSERPDAVSGRNSYAGTTKERHAAYFDCDRQRNLSDAGRASLVKTANAMRSIGLIVSEVFSSPMCRTRETAWLLAGQVTSTDALIGSDNEQRQRLASTIPVDGSNRLLVSHGYIVKNVVPNPQWPDERGQIARGHAHVLDPLGDGDFIVLADLGPADWRRLAELAQQ